MVITKLKRAAFHSVFTNDSSPELLTICYQNHHVACLPRAMHKHDDRMEILFIQEGSGHYLVNGEKYHTQKGDILIYNSGVLHDECHVGSDSPQEIMIYSCSIAGVQFAGLPANHLLLAHQDVMLHSGDHSLDVEMLFSLLFRQVKFYTNNNKELIDHLVKSLLVLVYDLSRHSLKRTTASANEILGRRIQDYLDNHYHEEVSLDSIGHRLNVNKFYLAHVFKAYSGYSPVQYLIRRRIGEAQTLLLHSQHSVSDIAHQVGYNSISHFQQAFMKMVGMSPYKYRCFMLDKERNDYLLIRK